MELKVYNINGGETGRTIVLDDSVFAITPNEHAVYLDCKQYLADQRQGTHKSKERSEVSGSTRKLKRQKGTGGARSGDINSPVFVGGGRVFGPKPRDYRFKLNVKVKRLARRSALSSKLSSNDLIVVEDFSFEAPKTKRMIEVSKNLKLEGKSLFVLENQNDFVSLSARNVKDMKVVMASSLNTYDVVNARKVVLSESAIQKISQILAVK
ncbi:MAG: 50S ribosomal protein L4 [Bacteroidales bacterium]|nr:50S ribosomal protein L4 [Bacteroidales bacterium]